MDRLNKDPVSEPAEKENIVPGITEQHNNNINDYFEQKYNNLLIHYDRLNLRFKANITTMKNLKKRVKFLEKKLKCVANQHMMKTRDVLKGRFSKKQLDVILLKKRKVKWSSDDMSIAFALRYFSKQSYCYLRDTLKYPLPCISSLQKWASKIDVRHGILNTVLSFMNIAGQEMTNFEKCTILSFDEMKVNSVYEYDKGRDEVIGPHNQMQMVMARGLFANWKQPIYVQFDQKMTPDILINIIEKLFDINYNVVACVSDCGSSNLGLWKS